MAKADKGKPAQKAAKNAKQGAAKQSPSKAQAKKGKKGGKDTLEEQVLALGGNKDDLALLKDVTSDKDLVQGEQAVDVRTSRRLSACLNISNQNMYPFSLIANSCKRRFQVPCWLEVGVRA